MGIAPAPKQIKIRVPRHNSQLIGAKLDSEIKKQAKVTRVRVDTNQPSAELVQAIDSASEWNSLLTTARAERGPQWDIGTQQFLVEEGSDLYYDSTPLFEVVHKLIGPERPTHRPQMPPPMPQQHQHHQQQQQQHHPQHPQQQHPQQQQHHPGGPAVYGGGPRQPPPRSVDRSDFPMGGPMDHPGQPHVNRHPGVQQPSNFGYGPQGGHPMMRVGPPGMQGQFSGGHGGVGPGVGPGGGGGGGVPGRQMFSQMPQQQQPQQQQSQYYGGNPPPSPMRMGSIGGLSMESQGLGGHPGMGGMGAMQGMPGGGQNPVMGGRVSRTMTDEFSMN